MSCGLLRLSFFNVLKLYKLVIRFYAFYFNQQYIIYLKMLQPVFLNKKKIHDILDILENSPFEIKNQENF